MAVDAAERVCEAGVKDLGEGGTSGEGRCGEICTDFPNAGDFGRAGLLTDVASAATRGDIGRPGEAGVLVVGKREGVPGREAGLTGVAVRGDCRGLSSAVLAFGKRSGEAISACCFGEVGFCAKNAAGELAATSDRSISASSSIELFAVVAEP